MAVLVSAGCSYARKPATRVAKLSVASPDPMNQDDYYYVFGNSYADIIAEQYAFKHLIDVSRDGGNNDTIVTSLIAGINLARSQYPGESIVALVGWSAGSRVELWYQNQLISVMVQHDMVSVRDGIHQAYAKTWKPQYGWYRYQHNVQYAMMYCKKYDVPLIQWNSLDVFRINPLRQEDSERASAFNTYQVIENSVIDRDVQQEIERMLQQRSWQHSIRPHHDLYDGSNHPTQLAHQLKAVELSKKYHSILNIT